MDETTTWDMPPRWGRKFGGRTNHLWVIQPENWWRSACGTSFTLGGIQYDEDYGKCNRCDAMEVDA